MILSIACAPIEEEESNEGDASVQLEAISTSLPFNCPYVFSAALPTRGEFSPSSYVTHTLKTTLPDVCTYVANPVRTARTTKLLPVGARCYVSDFGGGVVCLGPFGNTMHRCPIRVPMGRPAFMQETPWSSIVEVPWQFVFRTSEYSMAVYGVYGPLGRQIMTCDYNVANGSSIWFLRNQVPTI